MTVAEQYTPTPSLAIVKFWQGIVEVVIRSLVIGLTVLALICAIAAVRDLGAPDTPIPAIERLRFDTRSPSGWLLLVALVALPIQVINLVFRFLTCPLFTKYLLMILIIDTCECFLFALFYFGGAMALGVHVQDWSFWRGRGTPTEVTLYGLDRIVPSVGAESVFSFFASFGYIALAVWIIILLVFGWYKNIDRYNVVDPKTIKAKDSEDTRPVTESTEESVGGHRLAFSEGVTDM